MLAGVERVGGGALCGAMGARELAASWRAEGPRQRWTDLMRVRGEGEERAV